VRDVRELATAVMFRSWNVPTGVDEDQSGTVNGDGERECEDREGSGVARGDGNGVPTTVQHQGNRVLVLPLGNPLLTLL
jgi:hypothetical protein